MFAKLRNVAVISDPPAVCWDIRFLYIRVSGWSFAAFAMYLLVTPWCGLLLHCVFTALGSGGTTTPLSTCFHRQLYTVGFYVCTVRDDCKELLTKGSSKFCLLNSTWEMVFWWQYKNQLHLLHSANIPYFAALCSYMRPYKCLFFFFSQASYFWDTFLKGVGIFFFF